MIVLGILGIQRPQGKVQNAITGMAGINGTKMRTTMVLALTRLAPRGDYKAPRFLGRPYHSGMIMGSSFGMESSVDLSISRWATTNSGGVCLSHSESARS